jgi:serine/threonine protein kinase
MPPHEEEAVVELLEEQVNEVQSPPIKAEGAVEDFIREVVALKDPNALAIEDVTSLSSTFDYSHVTKLNLPGCGLSELPQGFAEAFPNLSILFLSQNNFREMPPVIGACPKLQMVAFKSNGMTSIHPEALQPQLRWCILTNNAITEIPDTIERCHRLQKFMLSGNHLAKLPDAMKHCTSLELIRLGANRLEEPPRVLFSLPKLAWLGLADNPFLLNTKASAILSELETLSPELDELEGEILGQGAGGITRKITTLDGTVVALKQFHACMTSDGNAQAERRIAMQTAALASQLPALVSVYGQTPQGSLVMEYLEDVQVLADPPSLTTCSRDVYPENCPSWSKSQAEYVVTTLLETLSGLHRAGICHGDFYSHNILVHQCATNDEEAMPQVRLTDFGAAYVYDRQADYSNAIESTELRAFATFVDEINRHCVEHSSIGLHDLSDACRKENATFDSVYIEWRKLQLKNLAKDFATDLCEEEKSQKCN